MPDEPDKKTGSNGSVPPTPPPPANRPLDDRGLWQRFFAKLTGPARDPFAPETQRHITLIAFLAWVGFGADSLSSSSYGPEVAFRALGDHTGLGLLLAIATALTVVVIAISYTQVIELFPTGGGGYKVTSSLLGKRAGLVAGSALVADYVLTITISIAAGVDALFSLFPLQWGVVKLEIEALVIIALIVLNLRGVKETVTVLLPVFLGFVATHAFLIIYGIARQSERLDELVPNTVESVGSLSGELGWLFVVALFLRAYAMSGATYTGIEAVSNSVNLLAQPRVRTAKWTMFYIAVSLSFMAGGIILLYLLWGVQPVEGQTLNAVAFASIVSDWRLDWWDYGHTFLIVTLATEAGLLFVAGNTGFLAGPIVLANMAADDWVPHRFTQLSDRLVTKNGILLMGIAALALLFWTGGQLELLVILYSINVFLAFALTLSAISTYWWRNRKKERNWIWRFGLSSWGVLITGSILATLIIGRFTEGAWISVLVTGVIIAICAMVYRHYQRVGERLAELDEILTALPSPSPQSRPALDKQAPTAIFFVSSYRGVGIHTLLNVQRMFPDYFRNFVFLSVGVVEETQMKGEQPLDLFKRGVDEQLRKYVDFCHTHGLAATCRSGYGTDPVEVADRLAEETLEEFPNALFFAGTLVFKNENWMTRLLHNYTALAIQRRLHLKGRQLVIMPMLVDRRARRRRR